MISSLQYSPHHSSLLDFGKSFSANLRKASKITNSQLRKGARTLQKKVLPQGNSNFEASTAVLCPSVRPKIFKPCKRANGGHVGRKLVATSCSIPKNQSAHNCLFGWKPFLKLKTPFGRILPLLRLQNKQHVSGSEGSLEISAKASMRC